MLTVSSQSSAQEDPTVAVKVYLSVRPTTVGVGQELLINLWVTPAPGAHRQYHDLKLIITKPDGSKLEVPNIDTYVADGTMWMPWVCDQVGEWSFQLEYPGEYFAPGIYVDGQLLPPGATPPSSGSGFAGPSSTYATGVRVKPASTGVQKLTVQEDIVPSWPESPLPTGYWSRPVGEINREWWPILGSYPWWGDGTADTTGMWNFYYPNTNPTYNAAYGFVPWVSGPESAHIVWTRPYQMAGLMGADFGGASSVYMDSGSTHTSVVSDWQTLQTSLVLMGRVYHAVPKPATNGPGMQMYWECYDMRTGEVYWERPLYPGEVTPNLIQFASGNAEVIGSLEKPVSPVIMSISNGYLLKYNPNNGILMYNFSIAPLTGSGGTYYMNGYVLGIQDLGADAGAERYRLINWTTSGNSANFASRIISNTTYARSALPTASHIDWNTGVGCTVSTVSQGGIYTGTTILAFDLYTGRQIWNKTINEPPYSASANVADHGKLAFLSTNGYFIAFDLKTGAEVWRSDALDYPWDEPGWGAYSTTSGYGQMFWSAQTGIYAIDWATGKINWKFEKEAPPFETPYTGRNGQTVYPFVIGSVCTDGKLYAYSQEHTPDTPFYRGQPTVCIDVFTGEEVWSFGMNGMIFLRRGAIIVADGYMTLAAQDGVMYTFGIGKSETTLSAPQLQLSLGQKALLTGTVLDLSPAQPGAPCVAKESVAAQMEHIHLQSLIGGVLGNVPMIGVPVSLDVLDPNGNCYNIGVVTSDGYSGTFAFDGWTPKVAGLYTITATFMGDESYDSSFATAYLTVAEGADAASDNTLLYALVGATIAIIITIVLVGFVFRKK
ncbi:MAG: PQQ-binding-like beta-propeller repeat protein [Candidatus Bathyarchaeota archaeon]|nr:PQQ-binding-like beta-propeller repeat protein [Candidatus Termiticorpusculum sp.]